MNPKKTDNLIFLNQYGGPSNCPSSPPPPTPGRHYFVTYQRTVKTPLPMSLLVTNSAKSFSIEVISPRVAPVTRAIRFLHTGYT